MEARGLRTMCGCVGAMLALLCAAPAANAASEFPAGFTETPIASGLTGPTMVAWTPDERMFIIEKAGRLLVVPPTGGSPKVVLSMPEQVNAAGDRGMLGLAVDSQFANGQPYLYVLYTRELYPDEPDTDSRQVSTLLRLKIDASSTVTEKKAILGTAGPNPGEYRCPTPTNDVDCIPSDALSHSIGTVRSAPDGSLFVGSGDGSGAGDADEEALGTQDETSMRGKIMRVDRNGRGVTGHPFCPTDTNLDHVCTKLYAKGFRNPFRFHVLTDGRLAVGDVGWNTTEELDLIPPGGGGNYGWPCYEGGDRAPGYSDFATCKTLYSKGAAAVAGPAYTYPHGQFGNAIIGGPIYTATTGTDPSYPSAYRNRLFFGDYVGEDLDGDGNPSGYVRSLTTNGAGPAAPLMDGDAPVAIEKAPNGNLVYVSQGGYTFPAGAGEVREIRYSSGNRKPSAVASVAPTSAAPNQTLTFNGAKSSDPDRDLLRYSWNFGDGTSTSSAQNPTHAYTKAGCYTATLTVTDPSGASASNSVNVPVSATPLTASIAPHGTYQGGEAVTLTGSGTGGTKPSAITLNWNVVVHHKGHTHPLTTGASGSSVTFTAPDDHDSDSYLEAELTATDPNAKCGAQSGAASVKTNLDLEPETHPLTIRSEPAGAELSWSGQTSSAGFSYNAATGFVATVSAPAETISGGRIYRFVGWSDGGAASHAVRVPAAPLDLVARYETDPDPDPGPGTQDPVLTSPAPGVPLTPSATPAPSKPAPVKRSTTRRDRSGPRFSRVVKQVRTSPYLRGIALDGSGVRRVEVFLASQETPRSPCRFWSDKTRKLGGPRRCSKPVWMRAALTRQRGGVAWRVRPWTTPVPGRWLARVRATDRRGNRREYEYVLLVAPR